MEPTTTNKKERTAIELIVDALLTVYTPADDITGADELLTTAAITERLNEVLPILVEPMEVNEAMGIAGFKLHNAGQMDFRWMMRVK